MRLRLISCEIFFREMCHVVAHSPHTIDLEFLPKGLHDVGTAEMHARLQAAIDRIDNTPYDAILLGYGLCNNGIVGLTSRDRRLVVPRAHDCITLFMGSASRYMDYFRNHPGVYFTTTGWIERGGAHGELSQLALGKQLGFLQTYEEMVARYGEAKLYAGGLSVRTGRGRPAARRASRASAPRGPGGLVLLGRPRTRRSGMNRAGPGVRLADARARRPRGPAVDRRCAGSAEPSPMARPPPRLRSTRRSASATP